MGSIKKLFYDVETTGLVSGRNAIHQLSIMIDIDGTVVEQADFRICPHDGAVIDPIALEVSGVEEKTILAYPKHQTVFKEIQELLSRHVDKYNKEDKYFLTGYNNRHFDDNFLRAFWNLNKDKYFGSWFWSNSLDVMVLATDVFRKERPKMPNFKLQTVAKWCGVDVKEQKLHDSLYDVELTRNIYYYVQAKNDKSGDLQQNA